jgi:hypothetical protein
VTHNIGDQLRAYVEGLLRSQGEAASIVDDVLARANDRVRGSRRLVTQRRQVILVAGVAILVAAVVSVGALLTRGGDGFPAAVPPEDSSSTSSRSLDTAPPEASTSTAGGFESGPLPFGDAVQTVDLLVRGSGVEHLGQEVFDFGVVDSWSLRVDEVLFVSSVPSMQFQEPSRPYEFPPVEVGDVVIVGVGTSPNQVHSHRITSADGEVVVAATFLPLHLLNGHQSPWVLKFAAAVEEDDSVEFLHDARDLWDEQLAATVAELPAPMSDLEVIVAWVAEHDAVRAGERRGPIIRAYRSATSS